MKGQYLDFIKIEKNNSLHQKILSSISHSTPYLGSLNSYNCIGEKDTITGNDYLVVMKEHIIGYVGFSPEIETLLGKTTSIYYGILEEYYGQGLGKLILKEVSLILKTETDINVLIANVNNSNSFGIKTIESAEFHFVPELSDEEDKQYHKF